MKSYNEVKKVVYAKGSKDPFTFKFYDPNEVILGKPMREHLKFAMSYWHTIDADGVDMFGSSTMDKTFGLKDDPMAMYRKKADFAFELMDKLQIDYYCFHDVDIAPEGRTVAESIANFNEMVDYIAGLQKKHGKKLLWNTANNFGDKKFMAGAATSPNADVFAVAAAKVKAGIDAALKLGGDGYVFWGGREGYDTLLNTDMALELDNLPAQHRYGAGARQPWQIYADVARLRPCKRIQGCILPRTQAQGTHQAPIRLRRRHVHELHPHLRTRGRLQT